jgi:hypothetical protein
LMRQQRGACATASSSEQRGQQGQHAQLQCAFDKNVGQRLIPDQQSDLDIRLHAEYLRNMARQWPGC